MGNFCAERSWSVHRERQEREEAVLEGRQIQEEEPDDDNMCSPFKPISDVMSVVRDAAQLLPDVNGFFCVLCSYIFWSFFQDKDEKRDRQEANSQKLLDAEQEEEEEYEEEPDNARQTAGNGGSGKWLKVSEPTSGNLALSFRKKENKNRETFTAGAADEPDKRKKTRKLHLKRKHRVDPLRTEDGPAESPNSPPPPGQ